MEAHSTATDSLVLYSRLPPRRRTATVQPDGTNRRTIPYRRPTVWDRVEGMTNILTRRVSPIHISFPFLRRPRLTVSVWRRPPPEAEGNLLSIEVTNTGTTPVEVTGVFVGLMRTFLPAELLLGKRATKLPLNELAGDSSPPHVLDGGSIRWTANLDQVKEQLIQEQLRSSPRLRRTCADLTTSGYPHLDRFYTELADISPEINGGPHGRLAIKVDNVVRELTHRRLAVVVQYGHGGLYKAQARWEPPQGGSSRGQRTSPAR